MPNPDQTENKFVVPDSMLVGQHSGPSLEQKAQFAAGRELPVVGQDLARGFGRGVTGVVRAVEAAAGLIGLKTRRLRDQELGITTKS